MEESGLDEQPAATATLQLEDGFKVAGNAVAAPSAKPFNRIGLVGAR